MKKIKFLMLFITVILVQSKCWSCTIFCAKDSHGHVWVGNNEDAVFRFGTKINISQKTDKSLAYIYFDYAYNPFPQGGVNEAGLFYDFNSVPVSPIKDVDKKIEYPGSNIDFLFHVLGQCETVHEVIEFYERYKMPWMKGAQMNVADKMGNMGIIVADSAWVTKKSYQVSTNYNLCHPDKDNKVCWRYPIADGLLQSSEPNLELITKICDSTHQRNIIRTVFSNVHNLNTGEMWLYYAEDYKNPYVTTFDKLLNSGETVLIMRDLFPEQPVVKAYNAYNKSGFSESLSELNSITDSIILERKIELLSIGTLYQAKRFNADDQLISQVIQSSNSPMLLRAISKKRLSRSNKKLVKEKLKSINAGFNYNLMIWFILIGGGIMLIRFFIKKQQSSINKT